MFIIIIIVKNKNIFVQLQNQGLARGSGKCWLARGYDLKGKVEAREREKKNRKNIKRDQRMDIKHETIIKGREREREVTSSLEKNRERINRR